MFIEINKEGLINKWINIEYKKLNFFNIKLKIENISIIKDIDMIYLFIIKIKRWSI